MATKSNRSTSNNGNRGRGSGRGSSNNNPEGHNQYSGWMDTAKDRPMAAAAAAAAAVGAGVFLWSRRNQISDQISGLSEQLGEWTGSGGRELEMADASDDFTGTSASGSSANTNSRRRSGTSSGMNATGGGNASLGAKSGGKGITA